MASGLVHAVLWDMDGTLIDSEPIWIEAQLMLVAEHGGSWSYRDGLTLVGSDMDATAKALQGRGVALPAAEIIGRLVDEVTRSLMNNMPWRPGVRELADALRDSHVPQAIVTTSPLAMARVVADRLPDGSVSVIVAGEHVTRGKPDPEPYLCAARELGVDPGRCIAVEDSPTGLASAIAAGTIAIGVPHDTEIKREDGWVRMDTLAGVTVDVLNRLAARALAVE